MPYNCAIVDDEKHAIDILHDYINECEFLNLSKTYNNPLNALAEITSDDQIDFLFLDIDMDGMKGTELWQHLKSRVKNVIYASSNLEHDIRKIDGGFECYLGKPISPKRFTQTVLRLIQQTEQDIVN